MTGRALATQLGVSPDWVYSRGSCVGNLPYHPPRLKRRRYKFDEESTRDWLASEFQRSRTGVWLEDPYVDAMAISEGKFVEPPQEDAVYRKQLRLLLESIAVSCMTPREWYVVRAVFGLGDGREKYYHEVGSTLERSTERVRELLMRGLDNMRRRIDAQIDRGELMRCDFTLSVHSS